MSLRTRSLLVAAVLLAAIPAAAAAAAPPKIVEATANGNMITGGLGFAPADFTLPVGGIGTWRNTDFAAPHTVTERNGLWELTGGYFGTPINPPGFGPGAVVTRVFEAGTHQFLCTVHPRDMTGSVAVPVLVSSERSKVRGKLRPKSKRTGRRPKRRTRTIATVTMRWAAEAPAPGLRFDVQRRLPGGDWATIHSGSPDATGTFRTKAGRTWEIRARLRRAAAAEIATGWSPPAPITT